MRTLILFLVLAFPAAADSLRVATYNASLNRNGAGLLINDLKKGKDPQIAAIARIIQHVRPDVLLINEFDYDADHRAANLFAEMLNTGEAAISYPHFFTAPPNTGRLSGFDLNGDGKTNTADDAFGFGQFPGQYGMLLLSRFPITGARTFATLPWAEFPGARLPRNPDGTAFPTPKAQAAMRLSSKSHWDVQVGVPGLGPLHVYASHPTPPVFDGPEDRNGLRNADEIRFWSLYIGGTPVADDQGTTAPAQDAPFVILGDLNADPNDGDGIRSAISNLLDNPRVQDPSPASLGAMEAATTGVNASHAGNPALDTADWRDDRGPGNLRVDYALPSTGLEITASGVFWPAKGDPLAKLLEAGNRPASDHHLVWVDIAR